MKSICLLVVLTFSIRAYSQSHINFVVKRGQPEIIGDTTSLTLPVRLGFRETDFKNKEIIFKDPTNLTRISGPEKKFGRDVPIGPLDTGFYHIDLDIIKEDNKVHATALFDILCPNDLVVIELMGRQFKIRYTNNIAIGNRVNAEQKYTAGYIFYDAMALVSDNVKPIDKLNILKSYGYEGSSDNPYLKPLYDIESKKAQGRSALTGAPFLTNLGNIDVTNLAAGLARFLAERTKEELNEAFFSKMKDQLNAYPELTTAFPKTTSILNTIESYSYASVIQVLKEAFENDVQALPENLYHIKSLTPASCSKIKDKETCEGRIKKLNLFFTDNSGGRWIGLGLFTVKECAQMSNPAALLKFVASSDELNLIKEKDIEKVPFYYNDYNIASSIELANLLSQSLISKDDDRIWVSATDLKSLISNISALKVYLGLLIAKEQTGDVTIKYFKADGTPTTFGRILIDLYPKFTTAQDEITGLVKDIHSAFNSANEAAKKIMAATNVANAADPQSLYTYYKTFISALVPVAHNALLNRMISTNIAIEFDKVKTYLDPSVDIVYHVATKKYSSAIYDATTMLDNLRPVDPGFLKVTRSFTKYGTIISTVASAQSSDEVKKAIEASVLPMGNYSVKRNSAWSISVNAYVGGFWGRAYTHTTDTFRNTVSNKLDTVKKSANYKTFGLYAPIGVSFSAGSKNGWSYTLTTQLFDLGALVDFYLKDGDQTALPSDFKVRLSNIFAPGVQFGVGIPKTPLAIMGGVQYVPALYATSQINSSSEIVASQAWRWHLSLVVDIPIFNVRVWDFVK